MSSSSVPCHGADESDTSYARMLSRINRGSPVEPAGSHGSIGFSIGAGARETQVEGTPVNDESSGFTFAPSEEVELTKVQMAEVQVIKGLTWPIDVGLAAGKSLGQDLQRFGGYAQWTAYESLAMPALAFRLGHSRLFGIEGQIGTTSGQALISYGFLRYFTLYGGVGGDYVQSTSRTRSSDGLFVNNPDDEIVHADWYENNRFYGARILVIPPLGALSAEAVDHLGEPINYALKLSIGM